jgi:peptide/nickel transport system substrate-binding protein
MLKGEQMKGIFSKEALTKVQAVLIAVILIVAAAIAAGFFLLQPTKPSIAVYAYATTDVVVFWDPSETYSNEVVVSNNVYEQLVRYDPFNDEFIPVLASSWSISDDGLVYNFTLRKGVKFHCGHEMTAYSVKYSIERNMHGWDGQGPKGASYIWDPVSQINVIDNYTVQFVLKYPASLLTIASAAYCAHIYCEKCTEQYGHDWFSEGHELGTGPYIIESYDKEKDMVVLAKFNDYWGGWNGKHFDKVIIKSVPEWSTARMQLEAGEVDFVDRLPFEDVAALEQNQAIEIVRTPAYQNMFGFFNTQKYPLNITEVRKAVSYAVPYDDIINTVMKGNARQASGPVPYGLWGHSEDLPQYTYNLTKARQLLIDAGFNPDQQWCTLVYTYNAGDEYERRASELLKSELSKIGINLDLRGMPWEQQWGLAQSQNPEDRQDIFVMYWWPDYPDPYTFLGPMFHSEQSIVFNLGYYNNSEYDRLIEEGFAVAGTNRTRAEELYIQAQNMLIEDCPAIFFFDMQYVRPKRASLKGYVDNPAYAHVVFWYNCYREE